MEMETVATEVAEELVQVSGVELQELVSLCQEILTGLEHVYSVQLFWVSVVSAFFVVLVLYAGIKKFI